MELHEEIELEGVSTASSPSGGWSEEKAAEIAARTAASMVPAGVVDETVELSPAAKILNDPRLPSLGRRDRATLLMQSPNVLYFYWSLAVDPYQRLGRSFGQATGYILVTKLVNETDGSEEIHPVEPEGNWWFRVSPNASYRCELGFYAPNRPYFRIIYSNTVVVPRKGPSERSAAEADWMVTPAAFAEVLDLSGYSADAQRVYEEEGRDPADFHGMLPGIFGDIHLDGSFSLDELRKALLAIAGGATLEELRWKISAGLFAFLQANAEALNSMSSLRRLQKHFGIDAGDAETEEWTDAVVGASLVHFPRRIRRRFYRRPFEDLVDLGPFPGSSLSRPF